MPPCTQMFTHVRSSGCTIRAHTYGSTRVLTSLRSHSIHTWISSHPSLLCVNHSVGDALPHFTFEIGLIPPLYFTALNCRHPLLHRKAIALLQQGSRRERLWGAEPIVRVAERVIELEDNNLEAGTDGWPEEKDRIHDVAISQRVVTSQHNGYLVQFRSRP
jgi:hypothetical protein